MKRIAYIALIALLIIPFTSNAETIDVQIKGVDDGAKTTKQRDYKEAVLFAKREAIERAGVKIKSMTTVKELVVNSDYIESQAEAVLLPGYNILDMGYSVDGSYQVVLIGKVKIASESLDSKELRYAKSLMDRGEKSKARKIIADIMNNSKNDKVVVEAMYCQVLWKLVPHWREVFEKLKAYYPNSKYISRLEAEREAESKRYALSVVYDKKTDLEWLAGPDIDTTWHEAKSWVKNLRFEYGGEWRMPTRKELKALYHKGAGSRNMTPLLKTTGWWVWSGETNGSSAAWGFSFGSGRGDWSAYSDAGVSRGFAVRSRR